MNQIRSILKSLDRKQLNCLTISAHEGFESSFQHINNVDFYAIWNKGNKKWNNSYRNIPTNYHLLYNRIEQQLPLWLDFDFILSHNKFDNFQTLAPIAEKLQLPLISVEHTCVTYDGLRKLNNLRGTANIFISDWSVDNWQWQRDESTFIIPHAINTELFHPNTEDRENICLVVANDLVGRGPILGFETYKKIASRYKVKFIGDTPGLSKPAPSLESLIKEYQKAKIILNAAPLSPIPMNLLEGMSCGAIPISLNACAVPDYVNEENGFLCHNDNDFLIAIDKVLKNKNLADKLSNNASSVSL